MKRTFNWCMEFLFIDQKTGELSHTKFWSNVGYMAMTYTFVYAVMFGSKIDVMIWALFGLIVIGNRTVLKLLGKNGDTTRTGE